MLNPLSNPIVSGLGKGLAGAFPTTTQTDTTGNSTTNTSSESNANSQTHQDTTLDTLLKILSTVTGSQRGSSTTTADLTPQAQLLLNKLTDSYANLSKPVDLTGYQAQQTGGINRSADLARQAAANIMASRGLSDSPVSGVTDYNIDTNRRNQITGLNQQIPILQNQMTLGNLGAASQFFNMIPRGTTTNTAQDTTQTTDTSQQGSQHGTSYGDEYSYSANKGSSHTDSASTTKTKSGGGLGGVLHGLFG